MRALFERSPSAGHASLALQDQERWYVVHTQPQREVQAAQQLENQDYRVFLPRFFKSRRHARKFETVLAPLFPRYMFIVLNLGRDRWRSVNGTYGVDRLLMRSGEPEPVPLGLVEQLAGAADANDAVRFSMGLQQGQTIRVTAGPFAELIGKLESLDDQGRVRVLLEIMGGTVPVLLPETIIVPT
jgi:transcription elongation factor/antiterminator RfaH